MILAGDIGGTNTRLALFDGTADRLTSVAMEVYPSQSHRGLEEIAVKFRTQHNQPVAAAAFGIAGPVHNGRCETSNLPWIVDQSEVAEALGIKPVTLLNDLEANAHGIHVLADSDFTTLNPGAPDAQGNRVLISAGTGLGEAGMLADSGDYRPYASEGGHADFAPRNEIEIELLRYLLTQFDRVSYERVLSGPGLRNIYAFLRDTNRAEEPPSLAAEMKQRDPSAVISERALDGSSDICVMAMELFVAIYGAEAGNLALKGMATGGVYVGGGIAPKILSKLREPNFLNAFWSKGRVSKLLKDMPVRVILNSQTALLGAGRVAMLSQ
jgi:glucokinase